MTKILTAHQPLYIPWLGFFQKVAMSDIFCLWDDVQFTPDAYIHRNRIKGPNGPILLTVPIHLKDYLEKTIKDMEIDNSQNWRRVHWNTMLVSYERKAPYFNSYKDFFEGIYKREWHKISDLDEYILKYLFKELKINVEFLKASELHFEEKKSDRVLDMCLKLNADLYIFGEGGEKYADRGKFLENGMKIHFQKYKHPDYPQLYGDFATNLSVLDLLFCFGERSYDIMTRGNPTKEDIIKKYSIGSSGADKSHDIPSEVPSTG
jgi:hypothetical protein